MKLIEPSFSIIEQASGIEGMYKQIELAGRTCYKSEDKITEDSAKGFVERMIQSGHGAMLEHGTVYLTIPGEHEPDEWGRANVFVNYKGSYRYNKYSKVVYEYWEQEPVGTQCEFCKKIPRSRLHITTNLRVLVENDWLDDLQYISEPTEYHEKRHTVKFICDRGVSHEFVRHRVFSFAQESTRYCNYSKDKFGNEITYILPCWMDELQVGSFNSVEIVEQVQNINEFDCTNKELSEIYFMECLAKAELNYDNLIRLGWKAQEARAILPNALKTELIMTGFESDWKHFFELRDAGSAHPQAKELAQPLHEEFIKRNWV